MNTMDRMAARRKRSSNVNNRYINNDVRAFICITIGFLAMTTSINMMYHRRFTKQTESDLKISSEVFKNGPRNKKRLAHPSSVSLTNKEDSKKEHDNNSVGTMPTPRISAKVSKPKIDLRDEDDVVSNAGGKETNFPSDHTNGNPMEKLIDKINGQVSGPKENLHLDGKSKVLPHEISKNVASDGDGRKVSKKEKSDDGDDVPEDRLVLEGADVSEEKIFAEDKVVAEDKIISEDEVVSKEEQVSEDGDVSDEEEGSTDMDHKAPKSPPLDTDITSRHTLAGLSCAKFGGPSDKAAKEMVYWSDIPSDSSFVSPFKNKASSLRDGKTTMTQYMTFEPDGGGWNNIRMAMETIVVMAHSMGRTLVLPPAQGIYLLGRERSKQNVHFSFADFFHLDSIDLEHAGIDIITTEEFLLREAMAGNLKNKISGEVSFPPNNRTNWDGQKVEPLKVWLREVAPTPMWKPSKCMVAFPASPGSKDINALNNTLQEIIKNETSDVPFHLDKPTPVDASRYHRLNEYRSGRDKVCVYDEEMQQAPVLHFMCYHKLRVRLLVHFYAFLFFDNWKQHLWASRFVRDHLRYMDELQCVAARVVEALREKARKNGDKDGVFDTFHVRRGDFQYKRTRIGADDLYEKSRDLIPENATLFIATDERDKKFFGPIEKHYRVYYLDDFKDLFEELNTNYYGMLDQLVASKGRTFVGTHFSTFTGYINRMRGYYSQKFKLEGYETGIINSYYFTPDKVKNAYRQYSPIRGPFFSREFPVAWRDIDKGIGSL